ncbi:MAG: caspase family protein [Candidatus Aminicenantaceae bacterium]
MKKVILYSISFSILLGLLGCAHTQYVANLELRKHVIDSSRLPKYDLVIGIQFTDETPSEATKSIKGDFAAEVTNWCVKSLEEDKIFKRAVNLYKNKSAEVDVILKGIIKSIKVDEPGISGLSSVLAIFYGIAPLIEFYSSRKPISSSATVKFLLIEPKTNNLLWSQVIEETAGERIPMAKSSKLIFASVTKTVESFLTETDFPTELNKVTPTVRPAEMGAAKKELPKTPAVTTSLERVPVGQHWAVIIGVSDYKDSRIPPLRYATADAVSFHDWLISPEGGHYPPSHVKLLVNKQATGQNIREALFVWLKQAIEEDMVLIFFAGHGSPDSPDSPENLFLLPYDVKYDNISTTGFPMWDIETALKRFVKAKKVVVMADACHAGGVGQAYDVARRANRDLKINPISSAIQKLSVISEGVAVLSASDDKQYSQEGEKWGGGHGVFSHFLLEGLKGAADYNKDNIVTLGELIPYLSEQVRRATRNAQSPTIAGKFDPALSIER